LANLAGRNLNAGHKNNMTKLTADEFATLPEALKAKFKAESDEYTLIEEDVEGLKKSKADILREKKILAAKLVELEAFKNEIESRTSQEEKERLIAEGNFKTLEEKLRAKLTETEQAAQAERAKLLATLRKDRLESELIKRGVIPERVKYAVLELDSKVELDASNDTFSFKVKDGIGDANEFQKLVDGLKTESPFFFAADGKSGSGASGGQGNGGGNAQKWESLTRNEKTAAIRAANGDMEAAQKLYQ
jgi:hypothetical protein